jgi:hypothetical protein
MKGLKKNEQYLCDYYLFYIYIMKTITKNYNVYTFDELSQEAKDKARNNYNADNEYMFLSDCMNERLHELLEENNIKDINDTSKPGTKPTQVMYSLSNSQGDGAMFTGEFEWGKYTVYIKHSGHYYHSNSKFIEIHETENLGFDIGKDYEPKVYKEFEELYQKICTELEKYGYNYIEYEDSEESFRELCESNEYTFLENGNMFND